MGRESGEGDEEKSERMNGEVRVDGMKRRKEGKKWKMHS